jgi:hypothetical protein
MSRTRSLPTLLAVACVAASAACSDTTSPTRVPPAYAPPAPLLITLNGVVRLTEKAEPSVILQTSDGDEIPLSGVEVELLTRLDDAGVEVRGNWDADGMFRVSDFLVRNVDGATAMDGVLIEFYDDDSGEEITGYGLRLTRSAILVNLIDPPGELLEHVGERLWVTGALDGPPSAFGIISASK